MTLPRGNLEDPRPHGLQEDPIHTLSRHAPPSAQRGSVTLSSLLFWATVAAAVYFGYVYGRYGLQRYQLRLLTLDLAHHARLQGNSADTLLLPFMDRAYTDLGVNLERDDVSVETDRKGQVQVSVNAVIAVPFPFTERIEYKPVRIDVDTGRGD